MDGKYYESQDNVHPLHKEYGVYDYRQLDDSDFTSSKERDSVKRVWTDHQDNLITNVQEDVIIDSNTDTRKSPFIKHPSRSFLTSSLDIAHRDWSYDHNSRDLTQSDYHTINNFHATSAIIFEQGWTAAFDEQGRQLNITSDGAWIERL